MNKFEVGDIVIGNESNTYGVTKKGWMGTVDRVGSRGRITVTGNPGFAAGTFDDLAPGCFDLYYRAGLKGKTEELEVWW